MGLLGNNHQATAKQMIQRAYMAESDHLTSGCVGFTRGESGGRGPIVRTKADERDPRPKGYCVVPVATLMICVCLVLSALGLLAYVLYCSAGQKS